MAKDEGLLLGDAARAIGVSVDTLRRWERAGKLRTKRDGANRRRVTQREIQRLGGHPIATRRATRFRLATAFRASCGRCRRMA